MDTDDIAGCVSIVARRLNEKFEPKPNKDIVIAGILKGVYMFMTDLSKKLKFDFSVYFIDASSYHGQEQKKVDIVNEINPEKFKGKTVIILDELFDKGVTMHAVKDCIKKCGADEVFTCALWSKKTPNQLPLPDFLGYEGLPSVWLVGYGLDDNGKKRNWTELYAVPKANVNENTEDDKLFSDEDYYASVLAETMSQFDNLRHFD